MDIIRRIKRIAPWLGVIVLVLAIALPVGFVSAQQESQPPSEEEGTEEIFDEPEAPEDAPKEAPKKEDDEEEEPEVQDSVQVTTDGTFEMHVQGAPIRNVLKQFSAEARTNIIVSKNVTGTVTADLYGVTVDEALQALLRSNGLVYQREGNFIYVYTAKEYEESRKPSYRVFRLAYLEAADAKTLVESALSEKGKISTTPKSLGGVVEAPTKAEDMGGANNHAADEVIIVYDYPENLKKIADIIAEIDVRPEQVLIEATILTATLNENNALGVNIQMLTGVNFNTFTATTDLTGITMNNYNVPNIHNGTQGRLNLPFDGVFEDGENPMTIGFIQNNVGVFVQALETVADTTVVANPKLLVVNKQRGDVLIGREDGYITTTVSETVATQTVEFLETGTKLRVRPFIGRNGFIRMELFPEISNGGVRVPDGSADTTPPLPSKTTTQVVTNVMVRDGTTIVIGGLFRDRVEVNRSQVPFFGDIPYIGTAFRTTRDESVREEIIILVTPHIIQHEVDEAVAEQIKLDIERTRIGARKTIQWWARSRLADTYVMWARQAIRDGKKDWALWNIDLALSIEPRQSSAIELKERLTEEAYWAKQPAYVSTHHIVSRMVMQELGLPTDSVVSPTRPLDANKIPASASKALNIKQRIYTPLPDSIRRPGEVKMDKVWENNRTAPSRKPAGRVNTQPTYRPVRSDKPVATPRIVKPVEAAKPTPKVVKKPVAEVKKPETTKAVKKQDPVKPANTTKPKAKKAAPAPKEKSVETVKKESKPIKKAKPAPKAKVSANAPKKRIDLAADSMGKLLANDSSARRRKLATSPIMPAKNKTTRPMPKSLKNEVNNRNELQPRPRSNKKPVEKHTAPKVKKTAKRKPAAWKEPPPLSVSLGKVKD